MILKTLLLISLMLNVPVYTKGEYVPPSPKTKTVVVYINFQGSLKIKFVY